MREDVDLEYKYLYFTFNFPVDKEHCMRYIDAVQKVKNINIERISVSDKSNNNINYSIEEFQYIDNVNEFIREYRNKYITNVNITGRLQDCYIKVEINLITYMFMLCVSKDNNINIRKFIDDIEKEIKWT